MWYLFYSYHVWMSSFPLCLFAKFFLWKNSFLKFYRPRDWTTMNIIFAFILFFFNKKVLLIAIFVNFFFWSTWKAQVWCMISWWIIYKFMVPIKTYVFPLVSRHPPKLSPRESCFPSNHNPHTQFLRNKVLWSSWN